MAVRIVSDVELTKFEILRDVDHERLPVHAAAGILGVSERHVWRLLEDFGPTLGAEKLADVHGLPIASRRCASG